MPLQQKHLFSAVAATLWLPGLNIEGANAQAIEPATDTETIVTPNGDRFDISGGSLSGDEANLFHSFEQFGLSADRIANFLSHPNIQNILARVVGGNPSFIDGRIQVTGGNANLYLMNPAGIILGANASLNVPGDFFATTATGIGFEGGIFNAFGSNDYLVLNGIPSTFEFDLTRPAPLVNAGDLTVNPGRNLGLIGGNVINTGTLNAPGGNILISTVPGTNRIKLSQPDGLLALEIEVPFDEDGQPLPITPLDLPELLVGAEERGIATGLTINADGNILLESRAIAPPDGGMAVVAGTLDATHSDIGGNIYVLGDRIGLFSVNVDASGVNGGGNIFIGGDYQGQGNLPTADRVLIDANSLLRADAWGRGNGGQIIAWSDEVTGFEGEMSARGGMLGGDGGFIEVSGKEYLLFRGFADVSAIDGIDGTILLDPRDITITDGFNSPSTFDIVTALTDQTLLSTDTFSRQDIAIDKALLETLSGNIRLSATRHIYLDTNVTLNFINASSVEFIADADRNQRGQVHLRANSSLIARNAELFLEGEDLVLGDLASIEAKDLTFRANNSDMGANAAISGTGVLTFQARDPGQAIVVGDNPLGIDPGLGLELSELTNIQDGFQSIVFDGGHTGGDVYFVDGQVLNDPVIIAGADNFIGPDRSVTWNLTGTGSGTIDGARFSNVNRLTGGSSNDTFAFDRGVDFGGVIDGGNGTDRLDYSAYDSPVAIDLANGTATATAGIVNIETSTSPVLSPPSVSPPSVSPPSVSPPSVSPPSVSPPSVSSLPAAVPSPPESEPETPVFSPPEIAPTHAISPLRQFSLNLPESEINSLDIADRQRIIDLLDAGDLKNAIALLDRYYSQNFLRYLGKENNVSVRSFQGLHDALKRMSRQTGTATAVLYIFARDRHLDLILMPPTADPIHYTLDVSRSELLAEIQNFQYKLSHPLHRRNTQYLAPSQQLYQWLIAPAKKDLQRFGIEGIAFVLDDGLRTLPMAALHDGKQFLVENYAVSLLPSFHLIPHHYRDLRNGNAIVMGMSEFSDREALPAVPIEVAAIADTFPTRETFLNEPFTFDTVRQQPDRAGANIVHLATHGQFQPGTPEESYIQLWDRKLSLAEMETLNWQDIELLVLSACRTAFGDEGAEYGFAGLSIQAGVGSAVASLWYASDTGTLALMNEFYQQLRSRGTKAEALRQSQIAMISGEVRLEKAGGKSNSQLVGTLRPVNLPSELSNLGDRNFQHPYYWSGFTLIGSPW